MGQPVNLLFPVKGLSRNHPYALAPEGTTPAALNVRPEDAIDHRFRGGRRGGLTKQNANCVANSAIQHITLGTTVTNPGLYDSVRIVRPNATAAGEAHKTSIVVGDIDGNSAGDTQIPPDLVDTLTPRTCCHDTEGNLYIAHYGHVYKYNPNLAVQKSIVISLTNYAAFSICFCPDWDRIAVLTLPNDDWEGAAGVTASLFLLDPSDLSIIATHHLGPAADDVGHYTEDARRLVWDSDNTQLIVIPRDELTTYGGGAGQPDRNVFAFDDALALNWSAVILGGMKDLRGGCIDSGILVVPVRDGTPANYRVKLFRIQTIDGTILRPTDNDYPPAIAGDDPLVGTPIYTNAAGRSDGTVVLGYGVDDGANHRGVIACIEWNSGTNTWDEVWHYLKRDTAVASPLVRNSIVVDSDDNVYVCGHSSDASTWVNAADGLDDTISVVKFSVLGAYLWHWDAAGPEGSWLTAAATGGPALSIYETTSEEHPISTTDYVFVQGGKAYNSSNQAFTQTGTPFVTRVNDVQSAWAYQNIYFVDGTNTKVLVLISTATAPWATYPQEVVDWPDLVVASGSGTMPANCRLICTYRGRVVLSGRSTDPHNWFMSAVNDPLDWDYAPATTVATQAVAGNNSTAGQVGDAITALIPYNDDLLIFGGVHSIHQLSGDAMSNGSIDLLTDQTGIRFGDAHCRDPRGALYFLGTDGVYMLAPAENGGTQLTSITEGRLDNEFDSINWAAYRAHMAWDYHRAGLMMTLVPYDATNATLVYYWSQQADSWWVDSYPLTMGPTTVLPMVGESAIDQRLLFGCRDGYIRYYNDDAETDDGTAVTSYVDWQLPATALDMRQAIARVQAILGESSADVTLQIFRGSTAQEAAAATTPALARTLVAGRAMPITHGVGGRHLRIRITSTGNRWAMEQLQLVMNVLGKGRKR